VDLKGHRLEFHYATDGTIIMGSRVTKDGMGRRFWLATTQIGPDVIHDIELQVGV
jgi:hypothetical protein